MAVAGETTESMGAAIKGNAKVYASIFHCNDTSSSPRVRRDGTMLMSSKANACWARLLRPISNTVPLAGVIRRVDRHLNIVWMRFTEAGRRDLYERAAFLQLGDVRGAGVEH